MNRVGGGGLHAQNMHFRHSSIFTPSHNTQYSEGGGRGRLRILKNFEEVGRLRSFKN